MGSKRVLPQFCIQFCITAPTLCHVRGFGEDWAKQGAKRTRRALARSLAPPFPASAIAPAVSPGLAPPATVADDSVMPNPCSTTQRVPTPTC